MIEQNITFCSGTEGVLAKIEAFAHQEFNNEGTTTRRSTVVVLFSPNAVNTAFSFQIQRSHHESSAPPPPLPHALSFSLSAGA
jgi:hypothetical protein